jgi:hypothetical protein
MPGTGGETVAVAVFGAIVASHTPAYAAGPDRVAGKGTIHAEGPASFTDITLTVNASDRTPGAGTDATGIVSISDRPSNGVGQDIQGDAFCVNATGDHGAVVKNGHEQHSQRRQRTDVLRSHRR